MSAWIEPMLAALALPKYGQATVFAVAMVSATLLPMGSEPAVFGFAKLKPDQFWIVVLVATMTLNTSIRPMQQESLDKHYLRKHGANAYYGQ